MPGAALAVAALLWALPAAADTARVTFDVRLQSGNPRAEATIHVRQRGGELREIRFRNDDERMAAGAHDGQLEEKDGEVLWRPPEGGGRLRYTKIIERERRGRNSSGHDAIVTDDWALFRAERAFPVVGWRRVKDSEVESFLSVRGPRGWSTVTPYPEDDDGARPVDNRDGRMNRPVGWILTGDIVTRSDDIAGIRVSVSAPRGFRMPRMGTLAVLRWTLPSLVPRLPGEPPAQVLIVSAGDPMWLGALAAPNSIFVHADRPLISGNGTSTLVHEMMHIFLRNLDTHRQHDWIDEGLAEYLSLWAMWRSGTLSQAHFAAAIDHFREWGERADDMKTATSGGAVTARAVAVFHDLDEELREESSGRSDLFDLVRDLYERDETVDLEALRDVSEQRLGRPARSLQSRRVPGF